MKSIFKNVVIITMFSLLTRMLGFFFHIYLSRAIGAEALGLYQVAMSIFMVLLTIVSSGITLIISRMTASYRVIQNRKEIGSLVSSSMILSLTLSVILCVVVLIFKNLFANLFTDANCINILIILLPSLIFSSVYSVFRGAMWGNDNFFGLCISELMEEVVKIVVCVLLLSFGMSAIQYAMSVAWSFTLSCLVSAFFVMLLYFFYGGKLGRPTKIYRQVLIKSAPITGVRMVGSFVQPLIALILPAQLIATGFTSSQAMELYGIAVGMTLPFLYVPSALTGSLATALVPDISMAHAQNDSEHIEKRVQSSLVFALFVSFLVAPIFTAIGDRFGVFIYDNALSGTLLQFSAWIMIPMGVSNIASTILNSIGLEVKSFINFIVGSVFLFVSILFLPKLIGVNALFVGMGLSSISSAVLNLLMVKKKLKIKLKITKTFLMLLLFSIPVMAISSFTCALFEYIMPMFFSLSLSMLIGMIIFVLLCLIFNVVNFEMYFVKFKEKFVGKAKISKFKRKNAKKT